MPVLLVLGRQEHQDLKANLGYIDTGLKKGGKKRRIVSVLNSHTLFCRIPQQPIPTPNSKHHKTIV